jgi:hypothetical protein
VNRPVVSDHPPAGIAVRGATPAPPSPRPGVSRWLRWVTYGAILAPLPSAVWRLGLAAGLPMGFSAERVRGLDVPGWGSLYIVGLSVVSMGLALLALGLIRPWGEVVPDWIPLLGCRRVPPLAAVIPAGLAAVLLTLLTVTGAVGWSRELEVAGSPTGAAAALMTAAYAPLLAWGPLLAVTTLAYWLRRRSRPFTAASTGGRRARPADRHGVTHDRWP